MQARLCVARLDPPPATLKVPCFRMGGGAKPNCSGDPREFGMPGLGASAKESYRWRAESARDAEGGAAAELCGRGFKMLKCHVSNM